MHENLKHGTRDILPKHKLASRPHFTQEHLPLGYKPGSSH